MTQRERMLAGKLYLASDPDLSREHRAALRLIRLYNLTTEEEREERTRILGELLGKMGKNIWIEPEFHCDYGRNIFVGDNFAANFGCVILDVYRVTIGDDVLFGPGVKVFSAGHPIDTAVRKSGLEFGRPVTVGDGVWVGGNTVLNPGVSVGSGTVIGSGSVVTRDLPPGVVAAGNPCRVLRRIGEEDRRLWEAARQDFCAERG